MSPPGPDRRGSARTVRGIVHVHSLYSYDGKHSLSEIAREARGAGLSFVCIAEHSDTLDSARVGDLVAECASLTSPDFVIVPGIEFTCHGGLHLLGFGVRSYDSSRDPMALSRFIRREGGVAVLAHPFRKAYDIPTGFLDSIDGIEVWNGSYDGSLVPNSRALDLYVRARRTNPRLVACVGNDLHRLVNIRKLALEMRLETLGAEAIVNALREGAFRGVSRLWSISGRPGGGTMQRVGIFALDAAYHGAQRVRAAVTGDNPRRTRPR